MIRIVDNVFDKSIPIIGIDFKRYSVKTKYGIVNLQIWDTSGQECFRSIIKIYFIGYHCFVLGQDITDKESFKLNKNVFYKEIFNNLEGTVKSPLIYLVANKNDI